MTDRIESALSYKEWNKLPNPGFLLSILSTHPQKMSDAVRQVLEPDIPEEDVDKTEWNWSTFPRPVTILIFEGIYPDGTSAVGCIPHPGTTDDLIRLVAPVLWHRGRIIMDNVEDWFAKGLLKESEVIRPGSPKHMDWYEYATGRDVEAEEEEKKKKVEEEVQDDS